MKIILSILLFIFSIVSIAQDSTLYFVDDSLHSKVIFEGDLSIYPNGNIIEHSDIGYIYYRADTAYQVSVFEENARFDY